MAFFRSSLGLATTGYFVAFAHIQRTSQALKLIRWDLLPVFNNPPPRSAAVLNPENDFNQGIIKSSSFEVPSSSRYGRVISNCSSLMAQLPEADCYILDEDRVECQSLKWFKGVLNRELITSNLLSILYSERRCVLPSLKLLSELDSQQQSSQLPSSTFNRNSETRSIDRPLLVLPFKSSVERHFGQPRSESSGERAVCESVVRFLLFGQPLALSSPCRSPLLSGLLGNQTVPEPLDSPEAHVLERYKSLRHLPPADLSPEPLPEATEATHEQVTSRLSQCEHLCRGPHAAYIHFHLSYFLFTHQFIPILSYY